MKMIVSTALTEVPVNVMPLVDDGDFKTVEDAVAYNAGGMDLVWNFVTTGGAFTQTAVTPTTGGAYDWTNQGNGMYSIEIPASGGASINNNANGYGWFTGVANGILPWRGPVIEFVSANVANTLVNGTEVLWANVTQWSFTNVATPDTAGYPKVTIKSGTGTGEVSLSSGLLAWNSAWDPEVQSECADALALYDAPTYAEMEARTLAQGEYATLERQDDHDTYLFDIPTVAEFNARTVTAATYATASALSTVDGIVDNIFTGMELDGSVYRWTTNALEQGPSGGGGGGASVEDIVAGVWEADPTDYAAGTMGGDVMKNTDSITLDNTALDDMWSRWMNTATSDTGSGEYGRAFHYIASAFSSLGVFSTNALQNAPAGEGGFTIPVNQVAVPSARTWLLVETDEGLRGEESLSMKVGESKVFAIDFRKDLPTNGRLSDVDAIAIETGTSGGVTFANTATDPGVDKTQAKSTITAVTAGTYEIGCDVNYQSGDGGGVSKGVVTLIVTD